MTVRVATAATLVLALAYPSAAPASEVVGRDAAEPANTPLGVVRDSEPLPRSPGAAPDDLSVNPYAGIGNQQLADVADRWEALNQDERRWFFVEVRKRLMATDGAPAIPIGASARFGQVVRDRAGTVVRLQASGGTGQPAATKDVGDDPRAYGLGFERRLEVQAGTEGNPAPASVRLPASAHQRPGKPSGGT